MVTHNVATDAHHRGSDVELTELLYIVADGTVQWVKKTERRSEL